MFKFLDIKAHLDFTVTIQKDGARASVVVSVDNVVTDGHAMYSFKGIRSAIRIENKKPLLYINDFFISFDEAGRHFVKQSLEKSTVPRTIGGWGMETIGAAARLIAGYMQIPTLTLKLTDIWSSGPDGATNSYVLRTDEKVRESYAERQYRKLGLEKGELVERLKNCGFYGIWGFDPPKTATATVGPRLGEGTLEKTQSMF